MKLLKRDAKHLSGHHGAQARVNTIAKAKVATWFSIEVISVWIWELTFISVGRSVGQTDGITRLHELTVQLDIPCESSLESLSGGIETQ